MKKFRVRCGVAALVLAPVVATADSAIEEIKVTEVQSKRILLLQDELAVSPDTAQLLKKVPGGNVNGNGPLTGIPQYRGMYGPRVGVSLNGTTVAPAGPNWMDPPLSYAAPSQLVKLEVYRGIAPVSAVQESIGGAIISETKFGDFTNEVAWNSMGRASLSSQSVFDGMLASGIASFANQSHHLSIAAVSEEGEDAEFPGGKILPSRFERQRGEIYYGYQHDQHQFSIGYVRNQTGNAGTPSLPMDIDYFDGDLVRLNYTFSGEDWTLNARLHANELEHGMTNFHLRPPPSSRAAWRQNVTDVQSEGFGFSGQRTDSLGLWNLGIDYFSEAHNGLIDNPNNPAFFLQGFNNASRSVFGLFVEREHRFTDHLTTELGVRVNRVESNADEVDGTPARMMPPAQILRDSFNAASRAVNDTNVDVAAKFWLSQSPNITYYAGVAHKTRSASFVERYLWLPLQATGGLADGFTYTGNLALEPEQSREIEFGLDWSSDRFRVSPRLFYKDVDDFIQGTPTTNASAAMFVTMMNRNTGASNLAPLQFNNIDAKFYGFDMDWQYRFNTTWAISGLVNYVRGERRDIDDDLYRIAPANASIQLSYTNAQLNANLELVAYDKQSRVSKTSMESATPGYEVVNLSSKYAVNERFDIVVGVNNLLGTKYLDHLAGYNRVRNADIQLGDRLPGLGRNVFLRLDLNW